MSEEKDVPPSRVEGLYQFTHAMCGKIYYAEKEIECPHCEAEKTALAKLEKEAEEYNAKISADIEEHRKNRKAAKLKKPVDK